MTTVLLSAGNATRMGDLAPAGCKAMSVVGGRTMIDWWRDIDPNLLVVCRTEHLPVIPDDVTPIVCDIGGGPATALRRALPECEPPVTVVYADTWVPASSVPKGVDWCGVAAAAGGRAWDVIEDGLVAYVNVDPGEVALVAVGLYRFADLERLTKAVDKSCHVAEHYDTDAGMADVVNAYGCTFRPVFGWQDIGDPAALAAWRSM